MFRRGLCPREAVAGYPRMVSDPLVPALKGHSVGLRAVEHGCGQGDACLGVPGNTCRYEDAACPDREEPKVLAEPRHWQPPSDGEGNSASRESSGDQDTPTQQAGPVSSAHWMTNPLLSYAHRSASSAVPRWRALTLPNG